MELEFNPQQTTYLQKTQTFLSYKKWLSDNGVLVDPRINYPSYFGQKGKGLIGVSASKPIEKGRIVIAVPYSLLITLQKVRSVQILNQIINQNSDVFGLSQDSVLKMLILYVCYELIKQKQSFYFPYFQICKEAYLQNWSHWQMLNFQNPDISKSLKCQKQEIQSKFLEFLRIFRRYEQVFPSQRSNVFYQKLFQRANGFICTRAFGWSLPSISLIPMADSLNHGNNYLNHFLIDTEEQKKPTEKYQSYKNKSNMSIFKDEKLNPTQEILNKIREPKKKRYEKWIQKHKQILINSEQGKQLKKKNSKQQKYIILYHQYKSGHRNIRQLHFYQSSCSQDNDTDQQELTQFVMAKEKFMFEERYQYPIKKGNQTQNRQKSIKKYWKLFTDNFDEDQIQQQQQQIQKQQEKKIQEKNQIASQYQEKHLQSQGSSLVSSTDSQQSQEQFGWMNNHQKQNYKTSYFVMSTREIVRQKQELHNFYGRRSNKFLLMGYNFVMSGNQYDSFSFRMIIDRKLSTKPNVDKLLYNHKGKRQFLLTKEVRLKDHRINIDFINHCRCYIVQFYQKQYEYPKITLPFSRQAEIKTLNLCKQILQCLLGRYMTSIQEDQQLINTTIQYQTRTAICYRLMSKKILKNQKKLINLCQQYLKRFSKGIIQKVELEDIKNMQPIKEYLKQLERGSID